MKYSKLTYNDLFQFHKGTIKTYKHGRLSVNGADFNSIKVRLKLSLLSFVGKRKKQFQFHKGTIKTKKHGTPLCSLLLSLFQFHKGTIKTGVTDEDDVILIPISIP